MENATKNFEENDKFSMYSDDTIQRERFAAYKKNNTDSVLTTINGLFDGISVEEAVDLLREKYDY